MAKGRTNKQGGASVSLTGDAVIAEVLNGKTFYNTDPKTKLTGTMPNKVGSATIITPSTSDQTIPQGYYGGASGDGKVIGDADLVPGNIKSGVNIFGVAGNYAPGGISMAIGLKNNVNSFQVYATLFSLHANLAEENILKIAMSSSGQYVYYIYYDGSTINLYKSSNYGVSYSKLAAALSGYLKCSSSGQYVINGTRISNDYGESFTTVPSGVTATDMSADGSIIYGFVTTTIWKSTNYGVNFSTTSKTQQGSTICCSDDGVTVYYSQTTSNIYKSTDGLATAGSLVSSGTNSFVGLIISQDGSKYAYKTTGSSGTPADSYEYSMIFNSGNYVCTSRSATVPYRCCGASNTTYWSSLFTSIGANSSAADSRINRVKGTNKWVLISQNFIYKLSE